MTSTGEDAWNWLVAGVNSLKGPSMQSLSSLLTDISTRQWNGYILATRLILNSNFPLSALCMPQVLFLQTGNSLFPSRSATQLLSMFNDILRKRNNAIYQAEIM